MSLDKIKSTIRAMLNLAADSAATEGEKQNAMRHVNRLMDEFNLKEEDLASADEILLDLDSADVGQAEAPVGKRDCMWMNTLSTFVAKLLGTVKVFQDRRGGVVRVVFYGVLTDCQIAVEIFHEVCSDIEARCRSHGYGGTKRGDGYRYCMGFISGLHSQLDRAKTAPPTSNALVVARNAIVEKKQELAERWATEQEWRLTSGGRVTVEKNDSFHHGFAEGSKHYVNSDRRVKIEG